jgi:hypothetical protein
MNKTEAGIASDKTAPPGLRLPRVLCRTQILAASGLMMTLKAQNLDLKE